MECIKKRVKPERFTDQTFIDLIKKRPNEIFSSGNTKLKKDKIHSFSLPAFKGAIAINGELKVVKTCRKAGKCAKWCYAQQGTFNFYLTMVAHTRNLQWVMEDPNGFTEAAVSEINRRKSIKTIRLHDSGDFLSWDYLLMWCNIANKVKNNGVKFYAYTKEVSMIKEAQNKGLVPDNVTFVFSFGGREDNLIDMDNDSHSKVFSSVEECLLQGYVIGTESDKFAAEGEKRIGLVYHSPVSGKNKFQLAN